MIDALRSIDRTFVSVALRPAFARFVRALCGPAARRLGWRAAETQPDDERLMREAILIALGDLGEDAPTLAEAARSRASAWLRRTRATPPPDLARIALPLAARRGDAALCDQLLAVLRPAHARGARDGAGWAGRRSTTRC